MTKPSKKPKEVVLMIADISGYTKFMMDNQKTIEHAQAVITSLMKTIIKQVKLPLKISKLEGDAVFLYSLQKGGKLSREERKKRIRSRLPLFISNFRQRAIELTGSTTCKCNACTMLEKLKLKIVLHSGRALFYRVGKFYELSGPDVIKAHRLLKNSVNEDEYILFTEQAFNDLGFSGELAAEDSVEHYDIGDVPVKIHYPFGKTKRTFSKKELKKYSSVFHKMKNMLAKMMIIFNYRLNPGKLPSFRNLGAEEDEAPLPSKENFPAEEKNIPLKGPAVENQAPIRYPEAVIRPVSVPAASPAKPNTPAPGFTEPEAETSVKEPFKQESKPETGDSAAKKKQEETDEYGLPKIDL